jgi:hypothetical protein
VLAVIEAGALRDEERSGGEGQEFAVRAETDFGKNFARDFALALERPEPERKQN